MKKIRVGIVGYGNLGKAIEKRIVLDDRFKPVVIFSRRNIKAKFLKTDNIANMEKYKNKIDIVFICVGSLKGLEDITYSCLKYFNTIDAFDTHKKINGYIKRCGELAKQYNHTAYCSIGWDPGLFSIMRVIFTSIGEEVYTTWGKGVSQGHSEAIRRIKYVEDAIQYTVPNKNIVLHLLHTLFF